MESKIFHTRWSFVNDCFASINFVYFFQRTFQGKHEATRLLSKIFILYKLCKFLGRKVNDKRQAIFAIV